MLKTKVHSNFSFHYGCFSPNYMVTDNGEHNFQFLKILTSALLLYLVSFVQICKQCSFPCGYSSKDTMPKTTDNGKQMAARRFRRS